jgi:hypothetical protein
MKHTALRDCGVRFHDQADFNSDAGNEKKSHAREL